MFDEIEEVEIELEGNDDFEEGEYKIDKMDYDEKDDAVTITLI